MTRIPSRRNIVTISIMGFAVAVLLLVVAFPMAHMIFRSFFPIGLQFTAKNYFLVFTDVENFKVLVNSLTVSIFTTIFATLIGVPMAYATARTDMPLRNAIRVLAVIPFITPPFIGAFAWWFLLNPSASALLNRLTMWLFHLGRPPFNIYGPIGLIFVQTVHLYPYVFLLTSGALESIDPALEEAGRVLGAKKLKVALRITLPLISPSIASGALLVFIASITEIGTPIVLGSPVGYHVLTTKIYRSMVFSYNIPLATALSALLLIISAIGLYIQRIYLGKKQYVTVMGKVARSEIIRLGKWKYAFAAFCVAMIFLGTALPYSGLAIASFQKLLGYPPSLSNLTLHNYYNVLFKIPSSIEAIKNSLIFAAISATAATLFGAILSYIIIRGKIRGRGMLDFLGLLPFAFPGTVVGLALVLWASSFAPWIYGTMWILILGYFVRYTPYAIRSGTSTLMQIDESLEEAGRIAGASWATVFYKITIPLMKSGLLAGWLLIFIPSVRELSSSVLLYSPGNKPISVLLVEWLEEGMTLEAAALAVIVLVVTLAGILIANKIAGRGLASLR